MPFLGGRGQASRGYFGGGTIPDAPTIGTATPGNNQISVTFTAQFDGGLGITTYQYALSTDSYATWTTRSTGTTASPLVITGLTNGTSYGVKIRAVNPLGNSPASDAATAVIPFGAPIVTTGAGSDTTASANAPTTNNPTSVESFSNFITQTFTTNGTWTNPHPSGQATGTGTLNGSAGTTSFIWGTTSGSYPNEVAATSNAYVRTTWPRGTTVYYKAKTLNSSCALQFNATVNANGNSAAVTFEYGTVSGVYPSSVTASQSPVTGASNTSVSAAVSSLAAGTYYFRVKAVNSSGTTYGTQGSVTIAVTSATATTEKSFTPPAITTLYEVLVVGGGGAGSMEGGGGGGVAASDSVSAGTSVTYTVGGPGTNPSGGVYTAGGTTTFGTLMSATGGNGGYPYYPGVGGSSGAGTGGTTYNSTSKSGGGSGYGCVDGAGGGGGGAEGVGQGAYIIDVPGLYTIAGGNGGAGKTIYGITVSSGGAGADVYSDNGNQDGITPFSSYGGGNFEAGYGGTSRPAQVGVVRFKYYGPA